MKKDNVQISHPGKVLFPDDGITKEDLAEYFERIAEYMLPHIKDRPLTLRRFTGGISEDGFFSKHAPGHFPGFIERLSVPMREKPGETMEMVMAGEAADLVYFAGQDAVELHMGLSRSEALEKPDQLIFDLDPSDDDFEKVRTTAFALKTLLDEHDIPSFVKTTGSRGLHIHIPLQVEKAFKEVKSIAEQIARKLQKQNPELTTMEHRKDKRGNKVFIDHLRNEYGMTAIAPYSPRALKGAPVATPIDWGELKDGSLGPQTYTLSNIFRRLGQKADPWEDFFRHRVKVESLLGSGQSHS